MVMLINHENLFLIILGLVWIIGAVLQDMKRREVDNLWNFSLIGFALAYRFSISFFNQNYWFVLNGIIGFIIFFGLSNLFYYSRMFAGGDAKLLMALGTILPLSYSWIINTKIFICFILLTFITGSIWALVCSFYEISKNPERFSKEFKKQWKNYQKMFLISLIFIILWTLFALIISQTTLILIGLIILLFPLLFVFAKSVEESCMVRKVSSDKITQGDWLYKDIFVKGKKIKSDWEGVSKKELSIIQKSKKKFLIKYGIPFTPSFLFAFIIVLFLSYKFSSLF